MNKSSLVFHLNHVLERIRIAEQTANRRRGSVQLLAVTKTFPAEVLLQAYRLGLRHFGENYLQEMLDKQSRLAACDVTWHFIGPVQSNKTRLVAEHCHWLHSLDREKVAVRLNEQRPVEFSPLNVLLQVNVSGEPSKSGVAPAALSDLVRVVRALPRLRLRGLMAIPAIADDVVEKHRSFKCLRDLYHAHADGSWDTLSMGMSQDLEVAVAEGATLVRIGRALFGERVRLL